MHSESSRSQVNWPVVELGELLQPDGICYGIVQPGQDDPTGIPVLRVKNLRDGGIDSDDVGRVAPEVERQFARSRLVGGEVLLSLVGSVGEVAIAPASVAGWNVARAIGVLRPSPTSSASWIRLCLRSEQTQRHMKNWQNETVQATLNLRDVRRLPIMLPPRSVQRAITGVVGALDDKIAANDRLITTSRLLGDLLLSAWLSDKPITSRIDDLQRRGVLFYGDGYRTKRAELAQTGLGILRVANIENGTINTGASDFVGNDYRPAIGQKAARANDVIVTTKGTVGRVAIVPGDAPELVYSPQVCYFRPAADSPVTSPYLWFWFQSDRFRHQASVMKGQTDMADYINLADIGSLTVEIPGTDDGALLGTLESLLSTITQTHRESRALAALRDELLPRLMSGEIRVREAEEHLEEML